MEFGKEAIDTINGILNSKKSKLSKKDREALIVLRERMKKEKTKKGWFSILKDWAKIGGAAASYLTDE